MQNSLFRLIVVSGQNIVTLWGWSKTYNSLLVCDWLMRLKHSIPLGVGVLVIDLICKFTVVLSKQVLIKAISRFVFFQLWTGLMAKCCSAASHRDLVIKELWQFDNLTSYHYIHFIFSVDWDALRAFCFVLILSLEKALEKSKDLGAFGGLK